MRVPPARAGAEVLGPWGGSRGGRCLGQQQLPPGAIGQRVLHMHADHGGNGDPHVTIWLLAVPSSCSLCTVNTPHPKTQVGHCGTRINS